MSDYKLWYNDISNRFSPTSLSHESKGSGYIASATISGTTTKSSWKMSLWDAYFNLRNILLKLNKYDAARILPELTNIQIATLSGITDGTVILNKTLERQEICYNSAFISTAGVGGTTYMPADTLTTTNKTQTTLTTKTIEENSVYLVTAKVLGTHLDHSVVFGTFMECLVKRVTGGSAVIVGYNTFNSAKDSGASSWGVEFTVSGNNLHVSVTGAVSTTITWECDFNYLKY